MGPYKTWEISRTNHVRYKSNKHDNKHTNHVTIKHAINNDMEACKQNRNLENVTKDRRGNSPCLQNTVVLPPHFP